MKRYEARRAWEGFYEPDPEDLADHLAKAFTTIVEIDGNSERHLVTAHDFFVFSPGDAERIVACLMACEGIDTELLEYKMLGNQIAAKQATILERDRAVDALEDIKGYATEPKWEANKALDASWIASRCDQGINGEETER